MIERKNTMNAFLYARFSPRPDEEKSESIELQQEHMRAYCALHNYTVAATFDDRALSGARMDNRPGLAAAVAAACKAKGVLVCYSLSRLARNTHDALSMADTLSRAGAHLAILDMHGETVDTHTPTGRCLFTMLAAIAELERRQTAQRTSDAMVRLQANGRVMSRHLPLGWKRGGKDETCRQLMVPDDRERAVRNDILSMHAGGLRPKAIIQRLHDDGVRFRGNTWFPRSLLYKVLAESQTTTEASAAPKAARAPLGPATP